MMNIPRKIGRLIAGRWRLTLATLILGLDAWSAELQLPVLRTRTGHLTNVTVMGMSKTDIFVKHSRGIGNIKLASLDGETLHRLGLGPATAAEEETAPQGSPRGKTESKLNLGTAARLKIPKLPITLPHLEAPAVLASIRPTPNILTLAAALVLGIYFFFCRCLKLICEKSGQPPGGMIWIPGLQVFPLLRAAGMSGWWVAVFPIAYLVWPFKIVQARGKSALVALLLILPLLNLLAIMYLAFSGGGGGDTSRGAPFLKLGRPPAAALGEA